MSRTRSRTALNLALLALLSGGADFSKVEPTVFGPDDPRTRELPRLVRTHLTQRIRGANLRESTVFAELRTREAWERYRDQRLGALRDSLGTFPAAPREPRVVISRRISGDGFRIENRLYETRPGWWVSANLYLPATTPASMPGILIVHSHHTPKEHGELQDMGMTWARTGAAVLIPDQLGYGERRQHEFQSAADYPEAFRISRQDYCFRYNSNLQLSAIGDSLMGWMVWDLMRGIDLLATLPGIDSKRILLMGAVAGGGDPAGVTAALDPRVAAVVPFNFGGWQPESTVVEDPSRDFAWFGDGYWESTRGLRYGARDGFAHFVIVGSVAPRRLVYAHEFAWEAESDPAWPRLQKIFAWYHPSPAPRVAHGRGELKGQPPQSSHCTHIGAVHRRMIYPVLQDWFGMTVPEEYSARLPASELQCWNEAQRSALQPQTLHELTASLADERRKQINTRELRTRWQNWLGEIEPVAQPGVTAGRIETVDGATLARFTLETEPGILVPMFLLVPNAMPVTPATAKLPAVVLVASGGKRDFLQERSAELTRLLQAGFAVCLPDVRGTGETRAGTQADRTSQRTTISQTSLILGQPMLGAQLRDLRTVLKWLRAQDRIDPARISVWGDSFAPLNPPDARLAVPLDLASPPIAEPGGAHLALLAGLFEKCHAVIARGGLAPRSMFKSPYLYVPHDAIVPAPTQIADSIPAALEAQGIPLRLTDSVDAQNRRVGTATSPADALEWLLALVQASPRT